MACVHWMRSTAGHDATSSLDTSTARTDDDPFFHGMDVGRGRAVGAALAGAAAAGGCADAGGGNSACRCGESLSRSLEGCGQCRMQAEELLLCGRSGDDAAFMGSLRCDTIRLEKSDSTCSGRPRPAIVPRAWRVRYRRWCRREGLFRGRGGGRVIRPWAEPGNLCGIAGDCGIRAAGCTDSLAFTRSSKSALNQDGPFGRVRSCTRSFGETGSDELSARLHHTVQTVPP
ncbi:hypothetical protein SAMN05421770_106168 [Granulicella rosea]|uniref:Uncharacterized protein n=1 Tax=Granulicella rosea TaxID=474952 RepID=A0A239L924_9BACT|nr:hypothetical protein SAMN05421770_106168 [Granulicella rosea]